MNSQNTWPQLKESDSFRGNDWHHDLLRATRGQAGLYEAFQILNQSQEERARAAADLHEREVWAITVILEASSVIWQQLPNPTLRFELPQSSPGEKCHLEIGQFFHLAALTDPSPAEIGLARATVPCIARAYPHDNRRAAGCEHALAQSYLPITVAEAIGCVGFANILASLEAATRAAGQALLTERQTQCERDEHVRRVESMLGWECEPGAALQEICPSPVQRLLLALFGRSEDSWLMPAAASLGVMTLLSGVFLGVPFAFLLLMVTAISLAIWTVTSGPGA